MTDNEIKKALESEINLAEYVDSDYCSNVNLEIIKSALDLINRLQAQNKDLAETVHNLTIEKDALFDKVEELKVEVERLKTNLNVELENFATEYDNKIKAEAYKEFANELKCRTHEISYNTMQVVNKDDIDNLLKELAGKDNGEEKE